MAELIAGLLGIAVGFTVLLVLFVVVIYNKLVSLRNTAQSSWSDIDVQLKKRHDLVPNLVETVKGYAAHEKSVFEKVTEARSMATLASSLRKRKGQKICSAIP